MWNLRVIATGVLLVGFQFSYAQFGNLKDKLVNKGLKIAKKQSANKLGEIRGKIDTASISLAVSFADNAGKFEQNDRLSNLRTFADGFLLDDVSPDPMQKARESNEMGELFYSMNQFWLAQVWFLDAKLEYEGIGRTSHLQYFKTIANLGLLYHTMGRYEYAEQFTKEALDRRMAQLGANSTATAASMNNMAVLLKDRGFYSDAESYFNQAIDIFSRNDPYGSAHAITLNNKAILFQIMGRLGEAEKLLNKSLQLAESNSSLREKSNNYQRIMVNLALLYQEKGEYEQAEEIYLNAIKIKEGQLKTRHPDYAHLLNNLASLYMLMGRYDDVEKNLKEALDIYGDKLGEEHPSYASTLSNLGNFYRYQGRTSEAMDNLSQSLEVREEIYGTDHPLYVQSKEDMALINWQIGNISEAAFLYKQVLDKELEFITTYFPPMTENEKSKYWEKSRLRFLRFYAFVADNQYTQTGLLKTMYEYHIATKALLLNISNKIREEILHGSDENLKAKYLAWLDKKETLVTFYSYSKEELEKEKIDIDQIEREANALERELSSSSAIFRKGYTNQKVSFGNIKNSLSPSQALVDVIQANKFDKTLLPGSQYLAMIITPENTTPRLVVLNNGDELEGKFFKYYKNSIRLKMADEYSYQNFWEKIDQNLYGKKQIFASFDGIYNQINVNTFTDGSGRFIIEKYNLVYLTNSKYLLDYQQISLKTGAEKNATLVGFPDYGSQGKISKLPGTKVEVENIDVILKRNGYSTDKYLVSSASEQNLKYVYDPSILHIATHGYFLSDKQAARSDQVFGIEPIKASENPLLRSGLFFSGAEDAMHSTGNMDRKSSNNGILTAYEAMNMHLNSTEIVILSACETGLGDVKSGEGVYGLQRAFQLAGSDAVLMSLWKVDDAATKDLMVKFYQEWLISKSKHDAFRKAQLHVKSKYKSPYFWGAFVLIEN